LVSSNQPFLCHFIDKIEDIQVTDSLREILAERPIQKNNSTKKKILILTNDYDPEANLVGIGLRNRGIDYVRLNPDDVPCQIRVSYSIGRDFDFAVKFTIRKQLHETSAISTVLLRNFDIAEKNFDMSEPALTFSLQQWNNAFEILQRNLACEWISSPQATLQASDRAKQLSVAKEVGFSIPDTLITNDPDSARDFYHCHDGDVVIKALRHHSVVVRGKMYSMFTRRILMEDLPRLDDLLYAPCILQEQLSEKSELRVTVVGDDVFTAELDSHSTVRKYDDIHRAVSDFPIRVSNLPDRIRTHCIDLIKSLGLRYGAIDFIKDDNGHLVFLEINPTGDWYWIERKTKLSITKAMVNLIEMLHKSESK
jgi:glutathione synthase/RimK-type ligase-like ATP-grasp enzyme